MSNIEALKEQARRHEQKEEWRKALDLYQRAIDRLAEADAPDIGLYNRVGDLYIRVGDVEPAVHALEQAVDLYVESELPNNAIAVCKKILRNVPDRHEVFLRMGQIRAEQGFLVDARVHFLTYAERMQARGELDEAVRALVEFADAAPDDVDIRLAIADHFDHHERIEEAVEQLAIAFAAAERLGQAEKSAAIRERLEILRPGTDPAELAAALAPTGDDGDALDLDDDGWDFGDTQPLDESMDEPVLDASDGEDRREAAIEEAAFADRSPDLPAEAAGADSAAAGAVEAIEPSDEAFDGGDALGLDDALDGIGPDVGAFLRPPADDNPLEGMDVVDELDEDDDEDLDVDLPFLHVPADDPADDEADDGTGFPVDAAEPFAPEAPAEAEVDAGAEAPAAEVQVADEPHEPHEPDELELRQRAVEDAHRSGDEAALADAYVELGRELRRTGAETRAQAILRQALQVDPNHPGALEALESAPAEKRAVAEVASSEDYVDLGALILGEEDEKTTRFVVAYEEPSGDEQADFVKMLSQFKAKVAENVDAGDVKAHHDLGTAYKEMGLLDEAVEEFQAALRASADHLPTYELLGQTFLERGTPQTAVRVLSRALDVPWEVEDELLGIYYFLGRSHEECGNKDEAREFYERVFSLDINFADVTERLRSLR